MATESKLIEGRIERVLFRNDESGFCVFELKPENRSTAALTVVGIGGDLEVGDQLRCHGVSERDPKYGPRFKAETIQRLTPKTTEGIEKYLAGPRVDGIGPEIARRLVVAFGASTLEVLDEQPERLTEVPGIGKTRAARIAGQWTDEKARRELLVFLQGHGFGSALAWRVAESLGEQALGRIQSDPFVLVDRVQGIGFKTADRLARGLGIAIDDPARLSAGLRYLLDQALVQGHFCLPGERLLELASELLGVEADALRIILKDEVRKERLVIARPSGGFEFQVYDRFAFDSEREAAKRLLAQRNGPDPLAPRLPDQAARSDAEKLSEEQREAVSGVLTSKVSVLTGGPGVGKTTVLRSLVSVWRGRGLGVALACPTGRAAKRLEEVSGLEAQTIHRLLGYAGGRSRFRHGEDQPIPADVVVIDEVSMLDLPLFLHLLRALPEGARLLLVGDADQLPSVGPGAVLRDLIASESLPVFRLTRVFRQAEGSGIVDTAHSILRGELPEFDDARRDLIFVDEDDPDRAAEAIVHLLLEEIPRRFGLDGPGDVQILSPMHKGPIGTTELNRRIQNARGETLPRLEFRGQVFCLGDRVMQTKNDYDRDLFNGDLGRVSAIGRDGRSLTARFDGVAHDYSGAEIDGLRPAWSMTVHKSQGGEFPVVIVPLFTQHFMLLKRSVLYTAVTRARQLLVVIGDTRALSLALDSADDSRRHGNLESWIRGIEPEVWTPPMKSDRSSDDPAN